MAKRSSRILVGLVCEVCKTQNYVTEKNKLNTTEGLTLKKYCKKCKIMRKHKESKKLD
ncbi:50S ribosomal protein L33 [Candidatus Roizmanbacteria bacterium RIFCSPLOWO2_01_FULL_38_12]|uniref:Large ribosomal subunit protein bL33 n=1 Tax=Candidatus Roizmanbacteria bacterium RIFCSPLOWO2_01_FULL_38_12 TaxID=1802061 RepID=A0A1F7IXZ0_9BACT|nr:MAG: 50S ribosomal protein L33 [Candidatus Roizmanbacteria bacterium RIFCSPHIGHO2_01_FULL_38_15]OGK35886.1 MAG: 50S ribosomal protein L33 [Candidatus Roizmanbacteria bacterium RIFCSPHIGHO2_12_FULL_38_13]OGK48248.1 MAG: 50S ribosomal protein L33 [Candidatus Roizmanbacteria bacterium RIFCSPLOWO2_01_FULL_38_12]